MIGGATVAEGDFDNDGRVNLQDLRLLKDHFGDTLILVPAAAVPEPPSWGLVLLAATIVVAFQIAASLKPRANIVIAAALVCTLTAARGHANSFMPLGDLPGGSFESYATGVSADGSVVVGRAISTSEAIEAFRWTSSGGMVGLGDLPGGGFGSGAFGVSADGSVVIGNGNSDSGSEAFRCTRTEWSGWVRSPEQLAGATLTPFRLTAQ